MVTVFPRTFETRPKIFRNPNQWGGQGNYLVRGGLILV
jgi:hypothetical protein